MLTDSEFTDSELTYYVFRRTVSHGLDSDHRHRTGAVLRTEHLAERGAVAGARRVVVAAYQAGL